MLNKRGMRFIMLVINTRKTLTRIFVRVSVFYDLEGIFYDFEAKRSNIFTLF